MSYVTTRQAKAFAGLGASFEKSYGKFGKAWLKKLTPEQRFALANQVLNQRGTLIEADATRISTDAATDAATDTIAATGQSKMLEAVPWVLGGIAGLVVIAAVAAKKRKGAPR